MCAAVKIHKLGKFDLNPRGNLWLKDQNRFGHKLLSKMGWSQGKGLGKNEDGLAENLKVKMKSGNTGVGWSEKIPLAAENEEYDAVLANLNKKFNSSENKSKKEDDVKSLELRSHQFKKRLHYGKFVRGKDVCRYSEKDMNSIFVTKKPKSEPILACVKSTVTNIESSSTEDEGPETIPTFKSQLSTKEYFEMKMKKKAGNTTNSNNITGTKNEETSEKEISSRKKGKNKGLKLNTLTSDESSSEGHSLDSIAGSNAENIKEASTESDGSRKKSQASKNVEKPNAVKLDPVVLEHSSDEGESRQHIFNTTDTLNLEEPSVKKESTSRKRSKIVNTGISKKLKLDPDLVDEHSNADTFKVKGKESHDIVKVLHCKSKSSKTNCNGIEDGEMHEVVNEVPKKKKKKNASKKAQKRKRDETEVVNISEESTSPESSEKELQDDLVLLGEYPESEVQVLNKKHKKLSTKKSIKTKSDALSKLKTCLKGSWNYSLEKESRKVSFNELVFYRTIKSDPDGDVKTENGTDVSGPVMCLTTDESMDKEIMTDEAKNAVENSQTTNMPNVDQPCNLESDKMPNCLNLPKYNNNNYNSWLENQRIASKMKLYQNMINKIENHPVLKTSNILDLKGYGNWGF